LHDELICLLFQAVVGTSRLPLTSVEAPLPVFTLGQLAYFYRSDGGTKAMRSRRELVECGLDERLTWREQAKWLETLLRVEPSKGVHAALNLYADRAGDEHAARLLLRLLRTLVNEVSLSPFTNLTGNVLLLAELLSCRLMRREEEADFLGHLLRQIGRHLTAYDFVRFHHAGANYPDALLLDAVLRGYLGFVQCEGALFQLFGDRAEDDELTRKAKRLRRRALRQAWLIRQRYRCHLVPDAPTSPGENTWVLPAPHARVPEEQIVNPHRRSKRLFDEDLFGKGVSESARAVLKPFFTEDPPGDNTGAVLRQSILDLQQPNELRELGMALFLDRPLGAFKAPGEPDQTPMLSYEAFSRTIAAQRLDLLAQDKSLLPDDELASLRNALQALPISGLPLSAVSSAARPGVVSLADAGKAADDFVFLRTTASSLRDFFALFDFAPLVRWFGLPLANRPLLVVRTPTPGGVDITLTIFEAGTLRPLVELSADPRGGYRVRAGVEYPRKGLRVRRVWENVDGARRQLDLADDELFVRPAE
jgi:hypothetical protein